MTRLPDAWMLGLLVGVAHALQRITAFQTLREAVLLKHSAHVRSYVRPTQRLRRLDVQLWVAPQNAGLQAGHHPGGACRSFCSVCRQLRPQAEGCCAARRQIDKPYKFFGLQPLVSLVCRSKW